MSKTKRPPRATKESTKRVRKKTSVLTQEKVDYVDYKDVNLLGRFVSDRSKIRPRRVNGNDVQQQNDIARAVKNARGMALLPYTKRVSSQRAPRGDRGERGERGDRGDRGDRESKPAEPETQFAVGAEAIDTDTVAGEE